MIKTLDKRQYLPSEKDIGHKDIKELSYILKEDSEVKTLTNILEWQERNITPWKDRWYMGLLLGGTSAIATVMSLLGMYIGIILDRFSPKLGFQIILGLVLLFLAFAIYGEMYLYSLIQMPLLSLFLIVLRDWAPLWYVIGLSAILGGIIITIIYLQLKYKETKRLVSDFKLSDISKKSLPVEKILKYRLAVCRDYAKLTAALLFNLYPENEVYFIEIPNHVATGIKIRDKIYVLDQKLPITSLDRWIHYWKSRLNKKSLEVTILKAVYQEGKIKIERVDPKKVKNLNIPMVDVNSFNRKLPEELGIEETTSNKVEKIKSIRLKDMALKYEKDEIVEYSMARAFKNKILNEFCESIKKITMVEVQQDGRDIVLNIFYL